MSIHVHSEVYKRRFGEPALKSVALKLADHASDDGTGIYPSLDRIVAETEWSKSTVQRAIRQFLSDGLLRVVREGGHGPEPTTEYAMDLSRLTKYPRSWESAPSRSDKMVRVTILPRRTRWSPGSVDGQAASLDGQAASLDGPPDHRIVSQPSGTVIDSRDKKKSASRGTDEARFSADVLAEIAALGLDAAQLVDRYVAKTARLRIIDPSAYLLKMARDEIAKRTGATSEQVKKSTSTNRHERIEAAVDATGAFSNPSPDAMKLATRRRRQHIDKAIETIAGRKFRTQADCDKAFENALENMRFRPPT